MSPVKRKCVFVSLRPVKIQTSLLSYGDCADAQADLRLCLFVLEFYGPFNNEVMSNWSVNSGTVPGQA